MMVMQISIVAILFIGLQVYAIPQDEHPNRMPPAYFKKCADSSGFKPPEMMVDRHIAPPEITQEFLCFLKCLFEEEGLLTDSGEVNPDKVDEIRIHMTAEKKEGLKKCLSKVSKVEKCEDLTDMAECMKEIHTM